MQPNSASERPWVRLQQLCGDSIHNSISSARVPTMWRRPRCARKRVMTQTHWTLTSFFVALIKRIPDLRVNAKDCWRQRNSPKSQPWHLTATIHCDSPCLPACFSLRIRETSKACQNHLQVKALLTYSTNCSHNSEQMEFTTSKKRNPF